MGADAKSADVAARASLLGRYGVPRMWTFFCAEIWLELESRELSVVSVKEADVDALAEKLGKERVAILRAIAYLGVAVRRSGKPGGEMGVNRPPPPAGPSEDAPAAEHAAAAPAQGAGGEQAGA